jgi:hypothetical protein
MRTTSGLAEITLQQPHVTPKISVRRIENI